MLTISWWVASVIVIFIALIFYVFGYRRAEKERDTELAKKIIDAKAQLKLKSIDGITRWTEVTDLCATAHPWRRTLRRRGRSMD